MNLVNIIKKLNKYMDSSSISSGPSMGSMNSEAVDPVWANREYLLSVIMTQCKITKEDLKNESVVRSKVRESKIEMVLG